MLIAYLTGDEVNADLAGRMAEDCGATLCLLSFNDAPVDGRFDAVVYDLDYSPPPWREATLAKLVAGPSAIPVAVHSFNLEASQVEALYGNGVEVYRRLDRLVFQNLALARARLRLAARRAASRQCLTDLQPASEPD
jgi:hypothetical protein